MPRPTQPEPAEPIYFQGKTQTMTGPSAGQPPQKIWKGAAGGAGGDPFCPPGPPREIEPKDPRQRVVKGGGGPP
jgi:hypothetical protein